MTIRVPLESIFVFRDGKQFAPTIGEPFDFTPAELADVERVNPEAIREAVSESVGEDDTQSAAAGAQKGGKKSASSSKENSEL